MKPFNLLAAASTLFFAAQSASAVDSAALDAWIRETVAFHHIAGLTAVVVQDGQTVFNRSYGVVDVTTGVHATPAHMFHMASVSKPVVAVAVMQLVEAGKVDLDAPITTYLPGFTLDDDRLPGVTVRRLLAHTSGMPDVQNFQWRSPENDAGALDRWVMAQGGKKLLFTPGEDREYSNLGFEILGAMVARVSGESFEAYVKGHIFTPLGMTDSTFLRTDVPIAQRVRGHTGATQPIGLDHYPYNRRHAPSSTFHTNGTELGLMLSAFSNPDRLAASGVLKAETLKEMWSSQMEMSEANSALLGWVRSATDTGPIIRHSGLDDGYRAEIAILADRDGGYGLMSNMETAPVGIIRDALRHAATDTPLPPVLRGGKIWDAAHAYEAGGVPSVAAMFREKHAAGDGGALYAIYFFARELVQTGKLADGRALADAMASDYPDHPLMHALLAEALLALGDLDGAYTAVEKALVLDPELEDATHLKQQIDAARESTQP